MVFDHVEYICDDRPEVYAIPEEVQNMTDDELLVAFYKAFGKYPDIDK